MGFGQVMDLMLVKKNTIKRQKNHGYWANYRFGIGKEIKYLRQKMGLINNAFWLTKGIKGTEAKEYGVWTKYGLDVSK